jgi:hypothetical protein
MAGLDPSNADLDLDSGSSMLRLSSLNSFERIESTGISV